MIRPEPRWILAAVAGCLLAACAGSPTVSTRVAPGVDVADYPTFAWFSPLGTDSAGYTTIVSSNLKQAVREALEAKGYRYAETDAAMLVNFNAGRRRDTGMDPVVVPSVAIGSWGSSAGISIGFGGGGYRGYPREEETLIVDFVDPGRQAMIWSGVAAMGDANAEGWSRERVRQRIGELFSDLPVARS